MALIAAAWATNATARNQNRLSRSAARTTAAAVRPAWTVSRRDAGGGGRRTTRACSGTAIAPYRPARMSRVVRQP